MRNAFKLTFILLFFLTACDSSESYRLDNELLPKKITTMQSYDAEPWFDYTHITTFEYDDSNRPTTILKETYRKRNTEKNSKDTLVNSVSRKLEYNLSDNAVKQTNVIKKWIKENEYNTHTETCVYDITNTNDAIDVTLDGKHKGKIELSKGLAVKYSRVAYSAVPEQEIYIYTEEYKYNDKGDISDYTYIVDNYFSKEKYSYDGYNGVYKHMNIPQWLFIALFGNEGRINNINDIYVSHDDDFVPFGNNINRYNSSGYVTEVVYRPDSEWIGIWGSKTTYKYVNKKEIALE